MSPVPSVWVLLVFQAGCACFSFHTPLSNADPVGHSFPPLCTIFARAHAVFLTVLSQEPTLCALLGPRTVWQAAGAQLSLLVPTRGHVSHFSWAWCPPDVCSGSPDPRPLALSSEHLHYRVMVPFL